MDNFLIRQCEEKDRKEIERLFSEFAAWHASLDDSFIKVEQAEELFGEYVLEHIRNSKSQILVADRGDIIAGYIFGKIMLKPPVYQEPRYGYVDNLTVDASCQRKGIGSALLKNLTAWFTDEGIRRIEIFAAVKNIKSTHFWRHQGFHPYTEQMYLSINN